jgi:hypothetical protein
MTIHAAVLAAGGVVVTAAWMVMDAAARNSDRDRGRDTAASASGDPGPAAESAVSGEPVSGVTSTAGTAPSNAPETAASAGAPSAGPAGTPRAVPYPLQWLDRKNSVDISDGNARKDRKGDLRLDCSQAGCALESDTSVFSLLYGEPGATYEDCRAQLADEADTDGHRLPLAAAAAGSEICVKSRDGDIALFVVQVKSTAMPNIAFVTGDMTVWRAD